MTERVPLDVSEREHLRFILTDILTLLHAAVEMLGPHRVIGRESYYQYVLQSIEEDRAKVQEWFGGEPAATGGDRERPSLTVQSGNRESGPAAPAVPPPLTSGERRTVELVAKGFRWGAFSDEAAAIRRLLARHDGLEAENARLREVNEEGDG